MTCAWSQEAIPCSEAHHLYTLNDRFFKLETPKSQRVLPHGNQNFSPNPSATAFQG